MGRSSHPAWIDKTGDLVFCRGCWPTYRLIYRSSVGRHISRYICRVSIEYRPSIDQLSVVEYQFEYRSSVNRVFAGNARLRTVACSALRSLFWIILTKKGVWLWRSLFWFEINFLFYQWVRPSFNSATREVKISKLIVKWRRNCPPSFLAACKEKQETACSLCEA